MTLHPIQIKPGPPMPIPPDNCASVTERQLLAKIAELEAQLAAARDAVKEMRQDHRSDCARINLGQWGRECDCGFTEILTARRALGLEV